MQNTNSREYPVRPAVGMRDLENGSGEGLA